MNEEVLYRKGSPDFVGFPCGTCSIHIRFHYVKACTHCILLIERDTGVKQPSCVVRACHGDGCHVFSGLEVEGISVSKTRFPPFAAVVAPVMSRITEMLPTNCHSSRRNKGPDWCGSYSHTFATSAPCGIPEERCPSL